MKHRLPLCGVACVLLSPFLRGTPAFAQTSFAPSTLSFGNYVAGNTSAPKTLTFTNTQTVPLTINTIAISGGTAPEDYAWGGNCPTSPNTMEPGANCSITVTFSPSILGSCTASLTISDSASTSPQSAPLTGAGTSPVILSANNRVFIGRMVGTTSGVQSVTLTNNGSSELLFSSIATSGDFAIASNTCEPGIGAGLQCTIGVTFTPTALGPRPGTLTITDSAPGSPSLVALSGTGNDTALTSISITPANASLVGFTTQQFTATGNMSTGATVNLTPYATWTSSTPAVATISPTGMAASLTIGSTTIVAALGAMQGTTTVAVTLTEVPASPIPASFFGMMVTPGASFPLAVNYGNFRVWNAGANVQWQGLQVCNSSVANCQQSPAAYTSLNTSALDSMLADVFDAPPLGPGIEDGLLFTLNRTPSWATQAPGYSDWQSSFQYSNDTYIIPTANNPSHYVFVALNAGTSGTAEPSPWNATRNGIQSDGTVTWQNIGEFTSCSFSNGSCLVPPDLYPDGSGPNQIWDNWIAQIASYLNDPTYLMSHPHIQYWEPLNEWFIDDTVNFNNWGGGETNATFAQILRLTEDTRCIIIGSGTIHNYPSQGNSTPCTGSPGYLQTLLGEGISTGSAIDPTALIVEPSNDPNSNQDMTLSQNFLYCNANPANDFNGATTCTWAPSGGVANCSSSSCWGSAAVDVINYHFYDYRIQPEAIGSLISKIVGFTSPADQAKPMISGEGGTGCSATTLIGCPSVRVWQDDASRAGFIPRFYALNWSYGLSDWPPNGMIGNWWNSYNCCGMLYGDGALTPEGVAYNTTFDWLAGSTPATNPFCTASPNPNTATNTIYSCSLTLDSAPAQLVWDSEFGPGGAYGAPYADCSTSPNPTICGNTTYTVPPAFNGWYDINYSVDGTRNTITSGQVTIGAVPILLVP